MNSEIIKDNIEFKDIIKDNIEFKGDKDSILESTQRYYDHFNIENSNIETFDIELFLSNFEDELRTKEIHMCKSKLICKCKKNCICDDDDFNTIVSSRAEMASNCKYITDLIFEKKINGNIKKNNTFKFFSMDDKQNENTLFCLSFDTIFIGTTTFILEETKIKENTISFIFDYMSWNKN